MNKLVLGVVVLLVVALGGFFLYLNSNPNSSGSVVDEVNGDVKTFVLEGENFRYVMDGVDNPEIRVNQGDIVRIEFTSVGGFHDWVVNEFDASTERVNEGGLAMVEFIADKKGEFEYYCSVGSHREFGMFGKFIVE
ncbi:MAG: multicopper oxidase domain-containing protein [Candidatus Pacearchaeota archaeon]